MNIYNPYAITKEVKELEKDKVVEILKQNGIQAANVDGVVQVYVTSEEYKEGTIPTRANELFKQLGYTASRGFISKKKSAKQAEQNPEDGEVYREEEDPSLLPEEEPSYEDTKVETAAATEPRVIEPAQEIKEDSTSQNNAAGSKQLTLFDI